MVRYLTVLPRRWEDWSGAKVMIEKEAGHTQVRRGGCCHYLWFHSGLVLALIQLQSGLVWYLFTFCEAFLRSVRNIGSRGSWRSFIFSSAPLWDPAHLSGFLTLSGWVFLLYVVKVVKVDHLLQFTTSCRNPLAASPLGWGAHCQPRQPLLSLHVDCQN